jgi:hypothetical protein
MDIVAPRGAERCIVPTFEAAAKEVPNNMARRSDGAAAEAAHQVRHGLGDGSTRKSTCSKTSRHRERSAVRLVADADVLLSAVIGGRASLALRHEKVDQVFTPAAAYDEAFELSAVSGQEEAARPRYAGTVWSSAVSSFIRFGWMNSFSRPAFTSRSAFMTGFVSSSAFGGSCGSALYGFSAENWALDRMSTASTC